MCHFNRQLWGANSKGRLTGNRLVSIDGLLKIGLNAYLFFTLNHILPAVQKATGLLAVMETALAAAREAGGGSGTGKLEGDMTNPPAILPEKVC